MNELKVEPLAFAMQFPKTPFPTTIPADGGPRVSAPMKHPGFTSIFEDFIFQVFPPSVEAQTADIL